MDKKIKTFGAFIIASAVIWGAIILACSFALRGTGCYDEIQNILVGGFIAHLILIWGPLSIIFKNKKDTKAKISDN